MTGDRSAGARRRITVYDIARKLGLSPSTVSRGLNKSVLVSDANRTRILSMAERMGYRKREIKKPRARVILNVVLVLPHLSESYIHLFYDAAELIAGIKAGFGGVRVNIITDLGDSTDIFRHKKVGGIDACIFAFTMPDEPTLGFLAERSITAVLLNRVREGANSIVSDAEAGMDALVERIVAKRRRPGICFLGFEPVRCVSDARKEALRSACAARGIPFGPGDAFDLESVSVIDGEFLRSLLDRGYDSVMCFNDVVAVYTYQAALHAGLPVPDAFSLTGFDNSPVLSLLSRRIDTITLSAWGLGREAGEFLHRRIVLRKSGSVQLRIAGEYMPGDTI